MSLLKTSFSRIVKISEREQSEKIKTPEVVEFIQDLKRLKEASHGHLNFAVNMGSEDPLGSDIAMEVVFGNNKSLKKYMDEGWAKNLLTIHFLRGNWMRVDGIGEFRETMSLPKDRGTLATTLALFLNEHVRQDVLVGARRKLNFA